MCLFFCPDINTSKVAVAANNRWSRISFRGPIICEDSFYFKLSSCFCLGGKLCRLAANDAYVHGFSFVAWRACTSCIDPDDPNNYPPEEWDDRQDNCSTIRQLCLSFAGWRAALAACHSSAEYSPIRPQSSNCSGVITPSTTAAPHD